MIKKKKWKEDNISKVNGGKGVEKSSRIVSQITEGRVKREFPAHRVK